ncbi:MAG TPA: WD40 repeat domain-containing protein [Gemmataceae bacterium]|nr:WD40 repeat domain-containing protein [Gemmataceae bacterium]
MSRRTIAILVLTLFPAIAIAQQRTDADGFPLPDGAVMRLGSLKFVAPDHISAVAITRDGKRIASGYRDIHVWNADTGTIVRTIEAKVSQTFIDALTWSKNGRWIAAMNHDTEFTVWDAESGKPHWQKLGLKPVAGKNVLAMRFVHDDRVMAFAMEGSIVELWNLGEAKPAHTWHVDDGKWAQLKAIGDGHEFGHVSLSPSGDLMAWLAMHKDRSAVLIYETVNGKLRHVVKNVVRTKRVRLLDEGKTLICDPAWGGKEEPTFAVVHVADGSVWLHCEYRPRPIVISGLPFNREHPQVPRYEGDIGAFGNGKILVTSDGMGIMRWDAVTGKRLQVWDAHVRGPYGNADGKRLVFGQGRRLQLCDDSFVPFGSGTEFAAAPSVCFQADGKLVAQDQWTHRLNIWDLRQRKIAATMLRREQPSSGRAPVSNDALRNLYAHHDQKCIVIRDLVANREICRLPVSVDNAFRVVPGISPDGTKTFVYEKGKDATAMRWYETKSGRELGQYVITKDMAFPDLYWPVAWYADDGSKFGYVARDSRLVLVDSATGKVSQVIGSPTPEGAIYTSEGFGRMIRTYRNHSSEMEHFCIYDAASGRRMRRFKTSEGRYSHLSPDGRLAAIGAGRFIETASGRLRSQVPVGPNADSSSFSPDGKHLAVSYEDTTILIWDLIRSWSGKPALPAPRSLDDADKLWATLGDADPLVADPALWALVGAPEQALAMMRKRLQTVKAPDPEWLRARIAKLDSTSFRERSVAADDLIRVGELALPALEATLKKGTLSLEQKRRVEEVLARIDGPIAAPANLRELRAVEVLERIGSSDARVLLQSIAAGDPAASLTLEARLALGRMPPAARAE